MPGAEEVRERLAAETGKEELAFSSVTGQGLDRLLCETFESLVEAKV